MPSKELDPIELTQQFVSVDSVTTHSNAAIAELMREQLVSLGFETRKRNYQDLHGTEKIALEAKRSPPRPDSGDKQRGIGYFCHNDVVSVEGWNCAHGGPFDAAIADGRLWGRGTCDMKGSAAAAMAAISRLDPARQSAPIYFFVTGDEERGMGGAGVLASESEFFGEMVATQSVGIIGEPTELQLVNSHKGGLHLDVYSNGVAAHSSTADGKNANWQMIPFLSYMKELWERSESDATLCNQAFSPSTLSFNIVIENRPAMGNITVGESICRIFFRPMPNTPWQELTAMIQQKAESLGLRSKLLEPMPPLHTPAEREFVQAALAVLGQTEPIAVCYATDGCKFHDLQDLIVIGPGSIEQAHRPDEWISLEQMSKGTQVFASLFEHFAFS